MSNTASSSATFYHHIPDTMSFTSTREISFSGITPVLLYNLFVPQTVVQRSTS